MNNKYIPSSVIKSGYNEFSKHTVSDLSAQYAGWLVTAEIYIKEKVKI